MQKASSNEITLDGLQELIESSIKDNIKQYEGVRNSITKAIMFLSDLHGGLIKLGWLCQPNNPYNGDGLSLFVDNMFTYGTNYIGIGDTYTVYEHRKQRLAALSDLALTIKVLQKSKDEIKGIQCNSDEDSLRQLMIACLSISIKFFENLKKQLRKSELHLNFGPEQIGHLVPLTVGHRDRPTDRELRYIKTVMALGDFARRDNQAAEDEVVRLSMCAKPDEGPHAPQAPRSQTEPRTLKVAEL